MSPMFASRLNYIQPFEVMEILARAAELEASGHNVVHFEVGEPDFATAQPILDAGAAALRDGHTKYTNATGIDELKAAIAAYYLNLGVEVAPARIIVTSGASGGLALLSALLLNPGDELLITDPGYPCNEVFVRTVGGEPRRVAVSANNQFQPKLDDIHASWSDRTRGLLLASPANPTGAMLPAESLQEIAAFAAERSGFFILDEIYQGLVRDDVYKTGLELRSDLFILNSFSKFFGMTGWRLGWVVVPEHAVDPVTRLAQNLFICPSAPAQYAALAAFDESAMAIHEERRHQFRRRCELLAGGLRDLGFQIPVEPDGAFYLYVDVSHTNMPSREFCAALLEEFHVAVTPGTDFGEHLNDRFVRFAFTTSDAQIQVGLERLATALKTWKQA